MKLNSFVSNGALNVTDNEVNQLKEMLDSIFADKFGTASVNNNTWEKVIAERDKARPTDCVFVKASFTYSLDDYVYGVNRRGDTIKFKSITFSFHHETGKCNNPEEEKLNTDKLQWQLWVYIDGQKIEYCSRSVNKLSVDKSFQYDTDFNEFDLESIKTELLKILNFEHATPKKLEKIKARFDKN